MLCVKDADAFNEAAEVKQGGSFLIILEEFDDFGLDEDF